jgi:hypothetical protein
MDVALPGRSVSQSEIKREREGKWEIDKESEKDGGRMRNA